jgi:uncharacterized protein YgfB (UPF0149 family)
VTPSVTHARLEGALDDAEVAIGASEVDGLLAGYVCGGGSAHREQLPAALQLDYADPSLDALLAQMHDACMQHLNDLELGLEPLLPDDARPLRERTDALVAWTRGFLGGFGLAGARAETLTDDGREVLRDLGTIAGSELTLESGDTDAADEDESALMELVEFARVGAMLLHAETVAGSGARRGPSR